MTIKSSSKDTIVWTAECPITYVDLYTPREPHFEGSKPQYQCTVLVDKEDKATLDELKKALTAAENKLTETNADQPFESLLNDGDIREDRNGQQISGFVGRWYFTAKNQNKPNLYKLTQTGAVPAEEGDIRNWDKGQAVIQLRAYDFQGRKGISARILGFCKTGTTRTNNAAPIPEDSMFAHLHADPVTTTAPTNVTDDDLPF